MYDDALSGGSVFRVFVHLYPKGLEAMAKMYQLVAVVLFQHLPEIVSRCLQCSVMTLCKLFSCCLHQQHHLARHSAAMTNMVLKRRRQSFEMSNICNFHNVSCHQRTFSKQPKILNHNIRIVVGFKKPVCVLKMVIVDVGERL